MSASPIMRGFRPDLGLTRTAVGCEAAQDPEVQTALLVGESSPAPLFRSRDRSGNVLNE